MDWGVIVSGIKDLSIIVGLVVVIWKGAQWTGVIKTEVADIKLQVNNHIPTNIKELDKKIDKLDGKMTDKITEVHERCNEHDKSIGRMEGTLETMRSK